MRIRFKKPFLLLIVATALINPAYAQKGEAESEALARVVKELELVKIVIDEAERKKENDSQYSFQYIDLKQDIQSIMDGIQHHLDRPIRMPVSIEPLKGAYSE